MTEPLQPLTDDDIAAARKLAGAIAAWTYDEDCNEPPVCCDCGGEYHMDDWSDEATPLCHGCAQRRIALVPRLLSEVERLRAEFAHLDGICNAVQQSHAAVSVDNGRLRSQLRARTLSDEERETLRFVRDEVDAGWDDCGSRDRALAVLDKLLKGLP